MTSRREFFKIIGAAAAVVVAPKASAIWLPTQAQIELPEPKEIEVVRAAIWDGRTIACYFFHRYPSDETLEDRMGDAAEYFAPGTPVLALISGNTRVGRYIFRGNRDAMVAGQKAAIAATWNVGEVIAKVRHEWTTSTS